MNKKINIKEKAIDFLGDPRLLSFIFPFLVMVVVFAFLEVYPVGDRTVLTVDLYHQYMPFIYEFRSKILEGRSLFYSFNSGLGTEYFGAFANYAASPLNLLCLLFPYKTLPVFVAFVTALRAGLASLFMGMLLSESDEKRYDFVTVLFGASYALSGWFLTDFWNIMWCDAFVLLPLVILGLRKLMLENKFTLYVISLAVCIISNFYAGYFICLFLVFFSVVYYFAIHDSSTLGFKSFFACAGKFTLGSLIAGMMSAVMVLPVYLILQHSSATNSELTIDYNLTGNLFDFLGRLMVSANPNIRDGMANVFCGVIIVLMIPLFFMAPKESTISLRHKIGFGFVLFFLYISFTNRTLDYIWHGFHFPNQIPYRQSFLLSFVLVLMAYMTIRSLKQFSIQAITAVICGAGCFVVLYEKFGEGKESYQQIGLTLLFIIIQGAVLRSIKMGKKSSSFYEVLIAITMAIEIFTSSMFTVARVSEHEGFTGYDFYSKNRDIIHTHAEEIEGSEGHNTFERTELYPNYICCIQSVYDVKGMSIFSSTARESFVKYMRNFGFHNNGINGLRNFGLTRVTADLLAIRNLATIESTSTLPPLFEEEFSEGDVVFYGNRDALSVGYMVSPELVDYEPDYAIPDVFFKTNNLVRAMGVSADVYSPLRIESVFSSNVGEDGTSGNGYLYSVRDTSIETNIEFNISNATLGSDIYVYVDSSKQGNVTVTCGDETRTFDIRSYQIIYLGKFDGNTIDCTIKYSASPAGTLHLFAYELNQAGYEEMLSVLSDEQFRVTYYDDTSIKGTIEANSDGLLFLSVPYSEGLEVYVDGAPSELVSIGDALSGVMLEAGTHYVELKYVPAGFKEGGIISLCGVGLFVVLLLTSSFIRKRHEAALLSPEISEDSDENTEIIEEVPLDEGGVAEVSEEINESLEDVNQIESDENN